MILEVTGVSTDNKGAELMLQASLEHYAPVAGIELAVTPEFGPQSARARYGLRSKMVPPESLDSRSARVWAALTQQVVRHRRGAVDESSIAGVIDASGFAFG